MCGGGGSGPPVPHLDPRIGPDYFYTYSDILKTHFIVRIGFAYFLSIDECLFEFRHFF